MKMITSIGKVIMITLLTGCSTGALTMYQAQETATVGNQVVSETKNYFTALDNLQYERAAVILAAQPNCKLSRNWKITVRVSESSEDDNPLCATKTDDQKGRTIKMELIPIKEEMFQSDLNILSAFSDYLTVLTAYTKDSTYPVEEMVDKALSNATNINGKDGFTPDQKNAISGMVMFLTRLSIEAKNGKDIGETLKKEGDKQNNNLILVKTHITKLKKYYNNKMSSDIINFSAQLYNKRNLTEVKENALDNSRRFVNLQRQIEKSIAEPTAAEIAIDKYMEYNDGLISIINNNITDEKLKEKQLEIQKDNLKEGLRNIKDLIKELSPLLMAAI
ncbi:hypothetical protein [Klebsiella quasipneumoniae]|uniref:hypothetical protein n=1 Tax=Klebsiella quasipneumoniae TaxID=1463165 RepID=UPI00352AC782